MITIKNATISCDRDGCKAHIETTIRRKGDYTGAGRWQFLSGDHYYGGSDLISEGVLTGWSIEQRSYEQECHWIYCPQHNRHNKKARAKSSKASSSTSSTSASCSDITYNKNSAGQNVGGPIVDGVERCSPDNMTPRFSIYDPTNYPSPWGTER